MRVINFATYIPDPATVQRLRPTHRAYMDELTAQGRLIAGGPFIDGTGAMFIYDAPSLEAAEAIVAADPYTTGGAFARTELKVWEVVKAQPTLLAPPTPA
jgi:uncharacterized protein YciI